MKKKTAAILAAIMLFTALSACGAKKETPQTTVPQPEETADVGFKIGRASCRERV